MKTWHKTENTGCTRRWSRKVRKVRQARKVRKVRKMRKVRKVRKVKGVKGEKGEKASTHSCGKCDDGRVNSKCNKRHIIRQHNICLKVYVVVRWLKSIKETTPR